MSFTPDLAQQEQMEATITRRSRGFTAREWRAEALVSVGFVAAEVALWATHPPHGLSLWRALLCTALVAIATRVRFNTPFGFTVATQLAFVPLLFAAPIALVPVAVLIAFVLAALPEVASGQLAPIRLVRRIGNSWFAIGPVTVFALANTPPRHADGWLLLAALAAQFLVDFVVSGIRFHISDGLELRQHLDTGWIYVIDAALSGVGLAVAEEIHQAGYAPVALVPLLGLLHVFARERQTRLEQLTELNNAYHGTALVLGDVVEADDGYTGEHSKSVVALCLDVAARLDLTADQKRNLEFGALLHDVGKIAVPKELINKPGKLTAQEFEVVKTHTVEGQKLLDTVGGFMRDVGVIVRAHHERWDGDGYPDKLVGDAIPLESRIISACDTWNAMRTNRSYRQMLPFETAKAEMERIAGSQLDPRIVAALLETVVAERAQILAVQPDAP